MIYAIVVIAAIAVFVLYSLPYAAGESDKKMRVIMDKYRREKGEG